VEDSQSVSEIVFTLFFYAGSQGLSRLLSWTKATPASRPNALPERLCIWRTSGFTNDEFRRHGEFYRIVFEPLHSLEKNASGSFPHVVKRLPNGGEPGIVVRRDLDVIEADY